MAAEPRPGAAATSVGCVIKPPRGCPGLQAGERIRRPGVAEQESTSARTAWLTQFFDHMCDPVHGEDGIQVQGLPRPGAAGGAEPHVRLRPGRVEPHPGRPPGPLAPARARATSYAESDRALTAMKKDPDLAFLNEVSSVPLQQALRHQHKAFSAFFAGRARYPRFKSRRSRQSAHYTRSRVHHARRTAAAGQDERAAAVRVVLAGCGRGHAGPCDGDRLAGAGRTLVCDLHR